MGFSNIQKEPLQSSSSLQTEVYTFLRHECLVVVQLLSRVPLFVTLQTAARQSLLSSIVSWSLLKFMTIESVMLFNHLITCPPLLLLPSIFPCIRVFSNESALCIRWPKCWSFSISPSNEYAGLISFTIDWIDLLVVQGTLVLLDRTGSLFKLSFLAKPNFRTRCVYWWQCDLCLPHPFLSPMLAHRTIQVFLCLKGNQGSEECTQSKKNVRANCQAKWSSLGKKQLFFLGFTTVLFFNLFVSKCNGTLPFSLGGSILLVYCLGWDEMGAQFEPSYHGCPCSTDGVLPAGRCTHPE